MDLFSLQDRLIVVTGAAGQIGQWYSASLLERGAYVAALDLTAESLDRLADHPRLLKLVGDVTSRESLEAALAAMTSQIGPPHGLVNNAGLDSPPGAPPSENGPYESFPEEVFDRVLEVNVKGVHQCCQVFGGAMAKEKQGSIVNIGSIYGLVSPVQDIYEFRRTEGQEYYKPIAYSVSKSALLNLSRYLATYWAKQGVRVNTLTLAGLYNRQDPRFVEAYCQRMPMGRMASEEDYIGPLVFLLSSASQYVTGSNLVVDGGWTAW